MSGVWYAHLNRGYLKAPFGSADVAEFEAGIDVVNGAAERSAGFVRTVDLDPAEVRAAFFTLDADVNRIAATLSVWKDPQLLADFTFKTVHGQFLSRRANWFEALDGPGYVVWPIGAGHVPALAEAKAAYDRLSERGPDAHAFNFKWLAAHKGIEPPSNGTRA